MVRADGTGGPLCVLARRLRRVAARAHFVAIAVVGGGGKEVALSPTVGRERVVWSPVVAFASGGDPSGGGGGERNRGEQAGRGRTTPRAYSVAMEVLVVGMERAQAQAVGLGHDVPGRGVSPSGRWHGEDDAAGLLQVRRCHDGVCDDAAGAAPRRLSRASQARGGGRVPAVGCHKAAAKISGSRCPRCTPCPNHWLFPRRAIIRLLTRQPMKSFQPQVNEHYEAPNVSINPQQPRETRDPGPSAPYSITNRI